MLRGNSEKGCKKEEVGLFILSFIGLKKMCFHFWLLQTQNIFCEQHVLFPKTYHPSLW